MCLIVLSVFVCFLFQIGVCSLELLWLTVDCSLVYFVIKLRAPFYRTPFSWEDPAAWVRSFTQNNCTCFCSGPSRPVVCWAVIELISQVRVVGPQRSCTFGPTSQELRFWFLLWRLKKKNPNLQWRRISALTFPLAEGHGFPCLLLLWGCRPHGPGFSKVSQLQLLTLCHPTASFLTQVGI